jgi:hypothetical protein
MAVFFTNRAHVVNSLGYLWIVVKAPLNGASGVLASATGYRHSDDVIHPMKGAAPMSTPITPAGSGSNNTSSSTYNDKLDIASSTKTLADYMRQTGKGAITKQEITALANDTSGKVPAEVKEAAKYIDRHPDVFAAIETHDVATVDNLSGVWNLDWAASGGLKGTATEAIAKMQDTFDMAIAKSAQITEITTQKKAELDGTKQRPQN